MVFSSTIFLFYFLPLTILLYFLSPYSWKNYVLLLASIFFFAWGAPVFIFILLASVSVDFYLGNRIYSQTEKPKRKNFLILSIVLNLGMLAYFKYANFFLENINVVFGAIGINAIHWTKIILPIGISFFTFQKMSYIFDIYRGGKEPLKKLSDFALYILLFPQLIAGPIVRYSEIADQLLDRRAMLTLDNKLRGIQRFIIGLAKKMLIANAMGEQVDAAFSGGIQSLGTISAWIVMMAYALQIYFDFSGYSDMAIGIGRILGFKIPENFKNPYISKSIIEFWKRWHISLTNWFRDYLFYPLAFATSRKLYKEKYIGLKTDYWIYLIAAFVTFFLTGFWHGASWNFVIWGAYHGVWLILDRFFLKKVLKRIGAFPATLFSFVIVIFGWVLFRVESLQDIALYMNKMLIPAGGSLQLSNHFWLIFILGLIVVFIPAFFRNEVKLQQWYEENKRVSLLVLKNVVIVFLLILSMSEIVSTGFNPFIYFRF
ncbi:MBOAT family O-acyltransferase [Bacteroidota bacterium]